MNHWLSFDLDYANYAHHPAVWTLYIWNSAAYTTFVAYVVWRLVNGMREREREAKILLERQQKIDSQRAGRHLPVPPAEGQERPAFRMRAKGR